MLNCNLIYLKNKLDLEQTEDHPADPDTTYHCREIQSVWSASTTASSTSGKHLIPCGIMAWTVVGRD